LYLLATLNFIVNTQVLIFITGANMGLHWSDSLDIALDLIEVHPDVDPNQLHFTQLMQWILALENFDDDPKHCGERVLEAVQLAWISEVD
jgi:FeS assembly protein IscX